MEINIHNIPKEGLEIDNDIPITDWDMDSPGARYIDKIPPMGPLNLKVRCETFPDTVFLQPGNHRLDFKWQDNTANIVVPNIHIHSALVLKNALKKTME